jgi:predicted acylesterase/phospholipase RssA
VQDDNHRVVVTFGGGAVPGLAGNLALAHLLEQLEIKQHVEEVWGTSAGAITAGCWGSGAKVPDILDAVLTLRHGGLDIAWTRLAWRILMRPFGGDLPDGLITGRHFKRAIRLGLACERLEDCPLPVRLIAVHDDGSMKRKVFRTGDLLRCIFASMAIPGIVSPEPVEEGAEETYYDGGLVEKTPLISPISEHVRSGDPRKLVLIGTHFDNETNKQAARGFLARFLQTIYALEDVGWRYQLEEARARDDVTLLLVNPKLEDGSLFAFDKVEDNFRISHERFADGLQNAKLALSFGVR